MKQHIKLRVLGLLTLSTLCTVLLHPLAIAADSTTAPSADRHGGSKGPRDGFAGLGQHRQANTHDPAMRIEQLDTNNDDKVSHEEFLSPRLGHIDDIFTRLDTNKNGLIELGEANAQHPLSGRVSGHGGKGAGPRGLAKDRPTLDEDAVIACVRKTIADFDPPSLANNEETLGRLDAADTNDDDKLSLAEVTAAVTQKADAHFTELDTNADGYVTLAELETLKTQHAEIAKTVRACVMAQKQ
jgi:hypothetical protein